MLCLVYNFDQRLQNHRANSPIHSLNLTAASFVHLLEPQWNPMVETQALDRVHRLGQKNHVATYRYIAKSTVDEVGSQRTTTEINATIHTDRLTKHSFPVYPTPPIQETGAG